MEHRGRANRIENLYKGIAVQSAGVSVKITKGDFCVDEMIEGYRHMADINLNFAELGMTGDLCCLEDYEFSLVEKSEDSGY